MGFPGYKDQSALSFLKGRSSRFLQFLCLFNHVEVNFLFCKCLVQFLVSSGIIRLLEFLIYSVITVNTVFFCGEGSFSVLRYFCKRCVFIHLLHLLLALFTFGVLGP